MQLAGLTYRVALGIASLVTGAALVAGCGGGSSGGGGNTSNIGSSGNGIDSSSGVEQRFGALTTRVVGTAQPPVISSADAAAVTGIAGASITSLVQNRTITAPTLAANATRIAYYSQDSAGYYQILTVPAGGNTPVQITSGNQSKFYPTWSPDGTKIAYEAPDSNGVYQVYTMPSGGGTAIQITNGNQSKYTPSWSPDGNRLVFSTSDSSGYYQLFLMPAGGGTATQITSGNLFKLYPTWSPDGTKIAYSGVDNAGSAQLFTVPADGGTPTQITNGTPSPSWSSDGTSSPSWSPDGTRIAYSAPAMDSAGAVSSQLFTVPANGGTPTQITSGQDKHNPSWSPDGTRIAYSANDGSGHDQIYTMPSGGGTATQITSGGDRFKLVPTWSPFLTSPKAVQLIGSGGLLGNDAAGFLFAQSGDDVLSVLAFDTAAATKASRAGARLDALTPVDTQTPNLIFSITTADSLGRVAFLNYNSAGAPGAVTAPALPAGTTGALVSFNAATGKVATVLPYAANRSVGTVQVSHQGTVLALHGRFLAVYDAAAENAAANQAPNGASEVQIDTRTGRLISFR